VGSERCPWLVVARRGQRIRITLYDLATTSTSSPALASTAWSSSQRQSTNKQSPALREGRCLLYATLREGLDSGDVSGDHMVCSGGDARQQVVYTSRDHTLTITIHYAPATRFVLQYEGLVKTLLQYKQALSSPSMSHRRHYASCPFVRPPVCSPVRYGLLAPKRKAYERKLVQKFFRAGVIDVLVFSLKGQSLMSPDVKNLKQRRMLTFCHNRQKTVLRLFIVNVKYKINKMDNISNKY